MSKPWKIEIPSAQPQFPFAAYWDEEESRRVLIAPPSGDPSFAPVTEAFRPDEPQGELFCPGEGCAAGLHYVPAHNDEPASFQDTDEFDHRGDCRFKSRHINNIGAKIRVDLSPYENPLSGDALLHNPSKRVAAYNERHPSLAAGFEHLNLRLREAFKLTCAADAVAIVRKIGPLRFFDSIFINRGYRNANEFFIHMPLPGEKTRLFKDFFDQLARGDLRPCLMQFQIDQDLGEGGDHELKSVAARNVFGYPSYEDGNARINHYIRPRAVAVPGCGIDLKSCFSETGDYLVLGLAERGDALSNTRASVHEINLAIRHPAQIVKADMGEFLHGPLRC